MMTRKDWVLLLVPIAMNGVLVYLFQYIVSRQFEKKSRKQQNQYRLLEEFQLLLSTLYDSCKSFADSLSERYGNRVADAFNQEILSYKQLNLYYRTHKELLLEYSAAMKEIETEAEIIHKEMMRIATEHGAQITRETIVPTAESHNKLVTVLIQTINRCEKEISKIYS